ncbi:MIP/aquaporin family protein [Alicyclobacillus macrosporangiidus]|jgi:glycerol uptake facilitator protein|uniref:Glycerol uptake facilitator protein n=1 Tax=Alicyclobacillus macrosporangiidus TaxID=392015 RepID=A0A1I7FDR1_9BACL|nr:MIP/aquaporin family protein [Alicyclobacillus macrosporangiidus]SFU34319.1 glycerol uptake facilitator protein [Alicyclobacillus macrosporangiidus]
MDTSPSLLKRGVAELIGTAMLVWIGAGTAAFNGVLSSDARHAVTLADVGVVSLAFGMVVLAMIAAFGPISGCHINPAVTVGLAVTGRFPWREVPAYVLAQAVGAVVGALGIVLVLGSAGTSVGNTGATVLAPGIGLVRGTLIEAANAFVLMTVIMGAAVDGRAAGRWAAVPIGLTVAGIIMATAGPTGSSFNPARTFGPYVVDSLFGGHVSWAQYPVYLIGPVAGAAIAAWVHDWVADFRVHAVRPPAEGRQTDHVGEPLR